MRFVPSLLALSSYLLAVDAAAVWVPGSARGCAAGSRSCPDDVLVAAKDEIEMFIGAQKIFEVYPTYTQSLREFKVSGGITMLEPRANGSKIIANKISLDARGNPNPEIELNINGTNIFEMYFNRTIIKSEFQPRGSIKVGVAAQLDNIRYSTIYAPYSPLVLSGEYSTLQLQGRNGIKLNGKDGATTAACTANAGVLGLYNGIISVCEGGNWVAVKPATWTDHNVIPAPSSV